MLGHQSVETTMVYAHLDPSRFKKDYHRFNFINLESENSGRVLSFNRDNWPKEAKNEKRLRA